MGDVNTANPSIDRLAAAEVADGLSTRTAVPFFASADLFASEAAELAGNDLLFSAHYTFGVLGTTLRTNDAEFKVRFNRIFGDCLQSESHDTAHPVSLLVRCSGLADRVFVEIMPDHDVFDAQALSIVSPDLQPMAEQQQEYPGWRVFSCASAPTRMVLAACGNRLVLDRRVPWQSTVAHYFLHHVMRLQRTMLFFHAATVAAANRGVLLSGPKGAGKSTLSLALTALGYDFLGDEIASVDGSSGTIWPFPRSVSIREGPQAQLVSDYVAARPVERELLPDGTRRMRMPVSELFPASSPRPVQMSHAFFLCKQGRQPAASQFDFSSQHLPLLAPLHATVANLSTGARTIRFLRLFGQTRCYLLTPGGTPDETAQYVNRILGE